MSHILFSYWLYRCDFLVQKNSRFSQSNISLHSILRLCCPFQRFIEILLSSRMDDIARLSKWQVSILISRAMMNRQEFLSDTKDFLIHLISRFKFWFATHFWNFLPILIMLVKVSKKLIINRFSLHEVSIFLFSIRLTYHSDYCISKNFIS